MTSTQNPLSSFILTPQQQSLLFAALNSNKPTASPSANAALNMSPSLDESPDLRADGIPSYQNSPDLDFDYDFGGADSSFDFSFNDADQARMIGDLPGAPSTTKSDSPTGDSPDKRSHPDDDDEGNVGAKRREGEEKVAKKPGRKPLTTEPSSKRKAQNRAAQRAFRERKEKHLKDLEEKVQELEKASKSTNQENELLRAKVEKMTVELNEYKKRISIISANSRTISRPAAKPWGSAFINNLDDVNFQFEFPKFGQLPGQQATTKASTASTTTPPVQPPVQKQASVDQLSPREKPKESISPTNSTSYSQIGLDSQTREDVANMAAGLFNSPHNNIDARNGSNISMDSHFSTGGATSTSSPSASSNSNLGASSSCGTSPEPFTQSPMGFKPIDTLSTIGEEHSNNNSNQDFSSFGNIDFNDFNWLPQNDFQFDPQVFGDYREPLSTGLVDDTFFNDAFDIDFITPYNQPITTNPAPKKGTDLISQIDAAQETDDTTLVAGTPTHATGGSLLTCNKIWERLQNCPKVQSGDFDLDGLCSDLQKKAKCSGTGAVVDEADFKKVMHKYLGGKDDCQLMANSKAN